MKIGGKEGEETASALIKALDNGSSLDGLEGIITRAMSNPERKTMSDIDALPPKAKNRLNELRKEMGPEKTISALSMRQAVA